MVTFWARLPARRRVWAGASSRSLGWALSQPLPARWPCAVPEPAPVLTPAVALFPQASKNAENATTGETAEENEAGD